MSKKSRRTALKSALLSRLRDGDIKVITDLNMDKPKTKEVAMVLNALGAADRCLISELSICSETRCQGESGDGPKTRSVS